MKESCPRFKLAMSNNQTVCIWWDMKDHLKDDCPDFIKIAVDAMAIFQEKLYGENPHKEIKKITNSF